MVLFDQKLLKPEFNDGNIQRSFILRSFERCMGGSGILSAVGAVVGLCGRWEAGNLLQRACGAMGLWDCTVGMREFVYGSGIAGDALTSLQEIWRTHDIHWPMNEDAHIQYCSNANMLRNHKARLIAL